MRESASPRRSSPLFFLGALAAGTFLVLVGVSLVQELHRRYSLEQQIEELRATITGREQRVAELKRLKEYLATDAYVERAAREKLNYQKPGEHVVIVPEAATPSPAPSPAPRAALGPSPAHAWLRLLFGPPASRPGGKRMRAGPT